MSEHHGKVWWNELVTSDVAKSRDYYSALLGWTYEEMPMPDGTYTIIKKGEESIGGMMLRTPEMGPGPDSWIVYLGCDNVDESVETAKKNGSTIFHPPFDVPNVGRIAMISDSTGAALGIMTPT